MVTVTLVADKHRPFAVCLHVTTRWDGTPIFKISTDQTNRYVHVSNDIFTIRQVGFKKISYSIIQVCVLRMATVTLGFVQLSRRFSVSSAQACDWASLPLGHKAVCAQKTVSLVQVNPLVTKKSLISTSNMIWPSSTSEPDRSQRSDDMVLLGLSCLVRIRLILFNEHRW